LGRLGSCLLLLGVLLRRYVRGHLGISRSGNLCLDGGKISRLTIAIHIDLHGRGNDHVGVVSVVGRGLWRSTRLPRRHTEDL
jgi:hypothetical protein